MSDVERSREEGARLVIARLIVGFIQGYGLWGLVKLGLDDPGNPHRWAPQHPALFGALLLVLLATPPILLNGVGALRPRALVIWGAVAAGLAAAIGAYQGALQLSGNDGFPAAPVMLAVGGVGFIAHTLVLAALHDRRTITRYPTYFDLAWKHGLQLALAAAFTGVVWAVLGLGVLLFGVIGLKGFGEFILKPWMAMPVTTVAFAMAVHLTDVRVGLIRGVRTVALTLLGWLTPLLAALALAFLAALPFTGLELLWKTGSATTTLISAAVTLVMLINAAYQDGDRPARLPLALDIATRLAGLLLTPLAGLAIYGLGLRIAQHGLSVDRIIAAAGLVILSVYAVGYGVAAVPPGRPMRRLEPTNVANAVLTIAIVLALLSPLANPVRLSVDSQVSRLKAGKIAPDAFDFDYLRVGTGRIGQDALRGLSREKGVIGERARAILASPIGAPAPSPKRLASAITVYPVGETLPAGFIAQSDTQPDSYCKAAGDLCDAFLVDLNGDGRREVLLIAETRQQAFVFSLQAGGEWTNIGVMEVVTCGKDLRPALKQGLVGLAPHPWSDLTVDGMRATMTPEATCETEVRSPTPAKTKP